MKKTLDTMTREERSLLLFFESAVVDHAGAFEPTRLNHDDFKIAEQWRAEGFSSHGRIAFSDLEKLRPRTNWCELSEEAIALAHEERRARAARMQAGRPWRKTIE